MTSADRTAVRETAWLAAVMAALLAFGALTTSGCTPKPGRPGVVSGVISCTTDAVRSSWPRALGPVNSCLVAPANVTACLLSLIDPVAGITESVIACLVRQQGSEFAASAQANPGDTRSVRAAENARAFIAERGYVYAE